MINGSGRKTQISYNRNRSIDQFLTEIVVAATKTVRT